MESKQIGMLIAVFVGVIIVFAMLPEIALNQQALTSKQMIKNEQVSIATLRLANNNINESKTVTLTYAPTSLGWNYRNCPVTVNTYLNSSGAAYTVTTHYLINGSTGRISFKNVSKLVAQKSNITKINYTVCGDGYVGDAAGRGIAGLIVLCAALGLIGFVVFYVLRDMKHWA